MGLTIHCHLSAPPSLSPAQARKLVADARNVAGRMLVGGRFDAVTPISDGGPACRAAIQYLSFPIPGRKGVFTGAEVPPQQSFLFAVNAGKDCEPLWLGLCRYPARIFHEGRARATRLGPDWQLHTFSKTQFASLRGWDHFVRCHCSLIDLLAALPPLGFGVKINDEGQYWPRRSLPALRRNLDEMNGVVAAAAGVLKDQDPQAGTTAGVQSPIFGHPQFERLEAQGASKHARSLKNMQRVMALKRR